MCPKNSSFLQTLIYGQKNGLIFFRTVCYTPLVCKTESTWFFNSLHHHHNESFLMSFAIDDRLLVASTVKENESRISLYFFSWASLSESRTRWRVPTLVAIPRIEYLPFYCEFYYITPHFYEIQFWHRFFTLFENQSKKSNFCAKIHNQSEKSNFEFLRQNS